MHAGFCVDQLRYDPDPVAALPHAAFEDKINTLLEANLFHIDRPTFVNKGGIPRDH